MKGPVQMVRDILKVTDNSEHPAPKAVYNIRLVLLAVSIALGTSMFGYDSGFIGGTIDLPSFQRRFKLDQASGNELASLSSNIVCTFQAGCFFGVMLTYYVTERLGRKFSMIFCGVLFDIGVVIQVASNGNIGMIYAGRAITGITVGTVTMVVPIYIGEWSPPAVRGRMVGFYEIVYQSTSMIAFWVNYGVQIHMSPDTDAQWRLPFGIQLIFGTSVVVAMLFQPESFRWLIKTGKHEQALKHLSYIRMLPEDDPYIAWEMEAVQEQINNELELAQGHNLWSKLKECTKKGIRDRIGLAIAVNMIQNLTGVNAFNYYSPTIFKSIGFKGNSVALFATGIFGIIKLSACVLFLAFGIEQMGRRNAAIFGSIPSVIAMFYMAIYTKASGSFSNQAGRDAGSYIAIVMIYVYAVSYSFSWGGITPIYGSEIIPLNVRTVGFTLAILSQWLFQFVTVYSTPFMMTNIQFGTFYFFGACLVAAIPFTYFFMPETQGLTLEDMDIMFSISGLARHRRKEADRIIAANRTMLDTDVVIKDKQDFELVEHAEA